MTDSELRLEILKLTHAHGRTPAEVVGRAKELEAYVAGKPSQNDTKEIREHSQRVPDDKSGKRPAPRP